MLHSSLLLASFAILEAPETKESSSIRHPSNQWLPVLVNSPNEILFTVVLRDTSRDYLEDLQFRITWVSAIDTSPMMVIETSVSVEVKKNVANGGMEGCASKHTPWSVHPNRKVGWAKRCQRKLKSGVLALKIRLVQRKDREWALHKTWEPNIE